MFGALSRYSVCRYLSINGFCGAKQGFEAKKLLKESIETSHHDAFLMDIDDMVIVIVMLTSCLSSDGRSAARGSRHSMHNLCMDMCMEMCTEMCIGMRMHTYIPMNIHVPRHVHGVMDI